MYQAELLAVKCCLETKVPVAQELTHLTFTLSLGGVDMRAPYLLG